MIFKTTTEVLEYSKSLVKKAQNQSEKKGAKILYDEGVKLRSTINSHLETGFFTNEARKELLESKQNALTVIDLYVDKYYRP